MDNIIKRLIIFSLLIITVYGLSSYIINNQKTKEISNNKIVNSSIERKIYESKEDFNDLLKQLNKSYKSTSTIKLLRANKLIENKMYNESLEVLSDILNTDSIIIKELAYSLETRALVGKGLCDNSIRSFNKIQYHQSIKDISNEEIKNCVNKTGGSK